MKLTTVRLLALATAVIALNACSSEPSDWRPDEKVSIDTVDPGHRTSDNFDLDTEHGHAHNHDADGAEMHEGGEGHEGHAVDSHGESTTEEHADHVHAPGGPGAPAAEATISANAEEGMRKRGEMHDQGKSTQDDTTADGHQR